MKLCKLNSSLGLLILSFLTMFVYLIELYMGLSRLPEHGLINSLFTYLVLYVIKLIHLYTFSDPSLKFCSCSYLWAFHHHWLKLRHGVSVIQKLNSELSLKDIGELHYFLRIEIVSNSKGFFLNQAKYAFEILEHVSTKDFKSISTPLSRKHKLWLMEP